jgi:hypothetical protein
MQEKLTRVMAQAASHAAFERLRSVNPAFCIPALDSKQKTKGKANEANIS